MNYEVQLAKSYFPAQSEDAIHEFTLRGQLRENAKTSPEKCALVEIGIDSLTGRRWAYQELFSTSKPLALALTGRFVLS